MLSTRRPTATVVDPAYSRAVPDQPPHVDRPLHPPQDWDLEQPAYLGRPRPGRGQANYRGVTVGLQAGCIVAVLALGLLAWSVANHDVGATIVGAIMLMIGVGGWILAVRNEIRRRRND